MIKKITAYVVENKSTVGRKLLVVTGCILGGLLIDAGVRRPGAVHVEEIIITEETPEEPTTQPENTEDNE